MPLDAGILADSIAEVLSGAATNETFAAAALNWANDYDLFILNGGTANGVPAVVPGPAALAAELSAVFHDSAAADECALGMHLAFSAYAATISFAGMVGVPVPSLSLTTALENIFKDVGGTHSSKATELANALLTYTNGIMVTFPIIGAFPII